MFHSFKYNHNGEFLYFIWENESGSLLKTDYAAFLVVKNKYETLDKDETLFYKTIPSSKINEILNEIASLEVPANNEKFYDDNCDIKAMCLHICHDCNLACKYCFASEGTYNTKRDYMSAEVGKKAIDFLIKHSGKRKNLEVDFFGGEPLLNLSSVKEIVSYARSLEKTTDKQFLFTLTTNAILLDDDTVNYLNEEMENVVISIDGRREIHSNCRTALNNANTYDVICENAKKFRKARGNKKYYIRGTFTSNNLDFTKDVLAINDLGFDQISIEPVVLPNTHCLAIKEEHIESILKEYENLTKEYIERRKTEKWFNFFHYMVDLKNGPCKKKRTIGCGAGSEYLAVTPNGDIYPCHQFAQDANYYMGNVFNLDFNRTLQGEFKASNLYSKSDCSNCFAKYFCSGGCAANNLHFAGNINNTYKLSCDMMKKRLEMAMAVYCIENYSDF